MLNRTGIGTHAVQHQYETVNWGRSVKYVKRIVIAFAACLITLVCVELVYSKMHLNIYRERGTFIGSVWPWIDYDPLMEWMNTPEYNLADAFKIDEKDAFRIDKNGFRIIKPSTAPGKMSRLIVCLGDSGTFGIWRDGETSLRFDSFPSLLQDNILGHHDVLINAGVLGYTSAHLLRQYIISIHKLKPQIIVIRVGHNDHSPSWDKRLDAHQPSNALLRYLYKNFSSTLVVQTLARYTFLLRKKTMGGPWTTLDQYESNLIELIRIAKSDGVKVFLVDYPLRPSSIVPASKKDLMDHISEDSYDAYLAVHEKYMQRMESVAQSTGAQVIRTRSRLEDPKEGAFYRFDAVHPNKHGMQIIAEEIAKVLLKDTGNP